MDFIWNALKFFLILVFFFEEFVNWLNLILGYGHR